MFYIKCIIYVVINILAFSVRLCFISATEFEEYPWEEKIMHSINVPCLGYVIQTSNVKWMVQSFARMFQNEKSVQRYNRTFLYLPVVNRLMSDAEFEQHISEVFPLRVMDFMPDLDVVKVVKEMIYKGPQQVALGKVIRQ